MIVSIANIIMVVFFEHHLLRNTNIIDPPAIAIRINIPDRRNGTGSIKRRFLLSIQNPEPLLYRQFQHAIAGYMQKISFVVIKRIIIHRDDPDRFFIVQRKCIAIYGNKLHLIKKYIIVQFSVGDNPTFENNLGICELGILVHGSGRYALVSVACCIYRDRLCPLSKTHAAEKYTQQ